MPRYDYECQTCGRVREVVKPMAEAGREERCWDCMQFGTDLEADFRPMKRLYSAQGFIMRPTGYALRPGDKGYSDFSRALELGEVRDPDAKSRLSGGATVSSKLERQPMQFEPEAMRGFRDAAKAVYNKLTGRHEW